MSADRPEPEPEPETEPDPTRRGATSPGAGGTSSDQCDTLCVRINNVIDLPDPIPEDDDDSYNCMNVDFDRYVFSSRRRHT
eukprot:COSAG02_NODE_50851_length_318_cov_0.479452_1_plen_80_part_01